MGYKFEPYCLSSYLAFRYVVKPNLSWIAEKKIVSSFPKLENKDKIKVKTPSDIVSALQKTIREHQNKKIGILLSSGIDSAIVASFLPKQAKAYTVRCLPPNPIDESVQAQKIANHLSISHKIIDVSWQDYQAAIDKLMRHKKSPLHPAEIAIYYGALAAKQDGVEVLFTGGAADSVFGGLDKLLSKDWGYQEFIERYNFLNPAIILKQPADITDIYAKYKSGNLVDVQQFLKVVFGTGTVQMFENAINSAGCQMISPFSRFVLDAPLDIQRIRNGEPKYLLKNVYNKLYPSIKPLEKIPFARPMNEWLNSWQDLHRPEFRKDIRIDTLTGEQKWLVYCLQRFLDLIEENKI